MLTLFIPVYMVLVLVSITVFDAYTPISNRILSPAHVAMLIVGLDLANRLNPRLGHRPHIRKALQALMVVILLVHLGNTSASSRKWPGSSGRPGGALAYFRRRARWWWPTEQALLERLPLEPVFEAEEGAVYVLDPGN